VSLLKPRAKPAEESRPKPVSCTGCGRTFSSPAAHQIAHDGRCLPDSMVVGLQLVIADGVYHLKGRA
jgi:hypothetical protein